MGLVRVVRYLKRDILVSQIDDYGQVGGKNPSVETPFTMRIFWTGTTSLAQFHAAASRDSVRDLAPDSLWTH